MERGSRGESKALLCTARAGSWPQKLPRAGRMKVQTRVAAGRQGGLQRGAGGVVGSASPAPHPHLGAVASSQLQEDLVLVPGGLWALGCASLPPGPEMEEAHLWATWSA